MTISLTRYTLEERVNALKSLCTEVVSFLKFAAEERETLDNFFVNLNEHNRRLTQAVGHCKRVVESHQQNDLITETLSQLTDAVLRYLSFVTIPDETEWHQWVMTMNTNVLFLEAAYEEAANLLGTQDDLSWT